MNIWQECVTWPDRIHLISKEATGCIDLDDPNSVEAVFNGIVEGSGAGREASILCPMKLDAQLLYDRAVVLTGDSSLLARPGKIVAMARVGEWTTIRIRFDK